MREIKSIVRLFIFTAIAFLQGLELILFQKAEVDFIDIEGVPYSVLDRNALEQVYTIEED